MAYGEAKVYHDGSHYIAIPHTTRPSKKRYKPEEETVEVKDEKTEDKEQTENTDIDIDSSLLDLESELLVLEEIEVEEDIFPESEPPPSVDIPRRATRKELFDEYYRESMDLKRNARKRFLIDKMLPYFEDKEHAKTFVEVNLERKYRNLVTRRIRLTRKLNLQEFNYFCTFTYDSKIHTEATFKRKLKDTFSNFAKRRGWKYAGVWERSPEKKRLHFHGLFYIPEGTMPGMFIQVEDYNFNTKRRQITNQSIYFNERFGRSDFEPIETQVGMNDAVGYIMKYIEKTGEKIVYSKGMPTFFITDILDDDIITRIGMEEQKLLLYDNFSCFDEGCYVGEVSPAVIKQLRTCN
jgi:hypothetical protein